MEIFGIRRRFRDMLRNAREAEQLRVQLAGVTTAALGWSNGNEAKQGQYGWSPAYQDVLVLRRAFDAFRERYGVDPTPFTRHRVVKSMCCGLCGMLVWSTRDRLDGARDQVIIRAGATETLRVVTEIRPGGLAVIRMLREPQGQVILDVAHQCHAVTVL